MSDRPYVAAFRAVQTLSEIPADALAELRLDVLSRVNDCADDSPNQPDVARARVLVAVLLQDLVESDERIREDRRDET